jgi:hypothetical protein
MTQERKIDKMTREELVSEVKQLKSKLLAQTKATNYYLRECNSLLLEIQKIEGTKEVSFLRIA